MLSSNFFRYSYLSFLPFSFCSFCLFSFLKLFRRLFRFCERAPRSSQVCVCVCAPSVSRSFLVQNSVCRGGWPSSYHTQRSCGQEGEAEPDQLRVFCFHGGSARYSPKQVSFTTTFQQPSFSRVLQTSEPIVQQFSCADRFTCRFPHPFHWIMTNCKPCD